MKQYLITPVSTGFFTGTLSTARLQECLNHHGALGWKFIRSIHESKKVFGIFSREAHFVIFERDDSQPSPSLASLETTNRLLQQLIDRLDRLPPSLHQ
jgi:hypothetical protein